MPQTVTMPTQGPTRKAWAARLLTQLGPQVTDNNLRALVAWETAETSSYAWNPLATTQPVPGVGGAGVKNYRNLQEGLNATVTTLRYPAYKEIVSSLYANAPAHVTAMLVAHSRWGTEAGIVDLAAALEKVPTRGGYFDVRIVGAAFHGSNPDDALKTGIGDVIPHPSLPSVQRYFVLAFGAVLIIAGVAVATRSLK